MGTQEIGPFGAGTAADLADAARTAWFSASRTRPGPDASFEQPLPAVDWIDHVDTDPIRALELLVLGWYPAEDSPPDPDAPTDDAVALLPPPLAAFHRLARLRPALYRFNHPMLLHPQHVTRPDGARMVFAVENQGCSDWTIPWPPRGGPEDDDPPVWHTEGPYDYDNDNPDTHLQTEPLSRFLLQFTLKEASGLAPFSAWTDLMPVERLEPLRNFLRPIPLGPYMPDYGGHLFYAAPGLLAAISSDGTQADAVFAARHRETLAPLKTYTFPWRRFDA
ncbi:hypothetical protein ACIGHB_32800 [Streptomyces sp. NPDC085460]|uniref:hypothetical protein n=1 Tax=Streptomyces sp. NPDC085460 TaxID=3365723 RepID=UPI0037CD4630